MSAKDAVFERAGSHHVSDDGSHRADGISKEEVFLYFAAKWRGKPVVVTMHADRYCASFYDPKSDTSTDQLTEWRVYAQEARYHDPEKNGGRGESVSGTARGALGNLCEAMALEWLASDAYTSSFQRALAQMVMRKFNVAWAPVRVPEALEMFRSRLAPAHLAAMAEALDAYNAWADASKRAYNAIEQTS